MKYAFSAGWRGAGADDVRAGLTQAFARRGHRTAAADDPQTTLVFHWVAPEAPRPFRRRGRGTYVVVVTRHPPSGPRDVEGVLRLHYATMVRALGNLLVAFEDGRRRAFVVTLERGAYPVAATGDGSLYESLCDAIAPLATSTLVIDNVFDPDLPAELARGDEGTRQLAWAGRRLAELDLLPAPFPLSEMLSPRDLRHVQRLYRIGGLSYGNISVRQSSSRFWMTGSGVDKGRLSLVGRDFLLVKGYDPKRNAIVLSVPRDVRPNRVSVDAIEHWMIYREHPSVGAILHVHAWMEGVRATAVNYPCGSLELAESVAQVLREEDDPGRAVVGLRNHGLTITGPSLEDIFSRIEGRLLRQVPMT